MKKKSNFLVGVIMGSKSDWAGTMEHCSNTLKEFGIKFTKPKASKCGI